MKKNAILFVILAFLTPSVFGQKVPIRWVKAYMTQPKEVNGAGIRFALWYPQVDSCAGAERINRYLKAYRGGWSDSNFKGLDKDTGGTYEEMNVVSVTYNKNGFLSFTKYWGYSLSKGRANDGYHFGLTFDTRTGKVLKTDDFIDQNALAEATALQPDDNCFLTKDTLLRR